MKRKPLINCAKTALRYKFEGLFDSNLTEDEITLVLQEIGFYMFKFEISPESKRAEESNRIRKETDNCPDCGTKMVKSKMKVLEVVKGKEGT